MNLVSAGGGITDVGYFDRGWYFQSGIHNPANDNYIAGLCLVCGLSGTYRDWFAFDIPAGSYTGASFTVLHTSYQSPFNFETYQLHEVLTPAGAVVAGDFDGGPPGDAIFTDLADGPLYGSRNISAADNNTNITVPLNAAALAAINAAAGHQFVMGGSLTAVAVEPGTTPGDPILPNPIPGGGFGFPTPIPRRWFDPPFSDTFEYSITGGYFLSAGLDLAHSGGVVSVLTGTDPGGPMLAAPPPGGTGGDGDPDWIYSFSTTDVTLFRISGIAPIDLDTDGIPGIDPDALPTFLDFVDLGGAFITMTPIVGPAVVPEPGTYILIGAGLLAIGVLRRRARR